MQPNLKTFLSLSLVFLAACNETVTDGPSQSDPPERGPRVQPGTAMGIYAPEQHDLYDGRYVIDLEEFKEFSPCQDGGIAAWLFEHGDSGCGDANWPKSILYVAAGGPAPPP